MKDARIQVARSASPPSNNLGNNASCDADLENPTTELTQVPSMARGPNTDAEVKSIVTPRLVPGTPPLNATDDGSCDAGLKKPTTELAQVPSTAWGPTNDEMISKVTPHLASATPCLSATKDTSCNAGSEDFTTEVLRAARGQHTDAEAAQSAGGGLGSHSIPGECAPSSHHGQYQSFCYLTQSLEICSI
jgi:hypothetical protein